MPETTPRTRITHQLIQKLEPPIKGNRITWDNEVIGFGARITAAGAISFVLRYVLQGREHVMTIGRHPDLSPAAARQHAIRLRGEIVAGRDPLALRIAAREQPTVTDLCADYLERHAKAKKRQSSTEDDASLIARVVRPQIGAYKVSAVTTRDIDTLHQGLKDRPYQANRALALLSKMFSMAVQWGWRGNNPCQGIARFPEQKRERWLTSKELEVLADALDEHPDQRVANGIRLLLLTGARRSEVLGATWDEFDLSRGIWTKPSAHTKQKREHVVPLSAPALALLAEMHKDAKANGFPSRFLFPGDVEGKPLQEIKYSWSKLCQKAGMGAWVQVTDNSGKPVIDEAGEPKLVWKSNARIHDMRHTFASHLVSKGLSLALVGRLLGHTQAATTHRYAHLALDPLREASDQFGAIFRGAKSVNRKA
jgi:integrase